MGNKSIRNTNSSWTKIEKLWSNTESYTSPRWKMYLKLNSLIIVVPYLIQFRVSILFGRVGKMWFYAQLIPVLHSKFAIGKFSTLARISLLESGKLIFSSKSDLNLNRPLTGNIAPLLSHRFNIVCMPRISRWLWYVSTLPMILVD